MSFCALNYFLFDLFCLRKAVSIHQPPKLLMLESELEDEDEIQGQYCGTYTFESVHFPGVYLRMDGNEVTEFVGPGGGVVNCQFGADAWEEFKLYLIDGCI